MATSQGTIDYLLEQMAEAGAITAKKMFGEYGVDIVMSHENKVWKVILSL
jgi:TfoX/Sxy family transcriptional regulator of competence genes